MSPSRTRQLLLAAAIAWAVALAGCGTDEADGPSQGDCPSGQERSPLTGQCSSDRQMGADADSGSDDAGLIDAGLIDAGLIDSGLADASPPDASRSDGSATDADDSQRPDVAPDTSTSGCPDRDGDGFADQACGGQDCDDSLFRVAPDKAEVCDNHDNDCDGQINQGLECSFYAHSQTTLYKVDPFEETATEVTSVPSLFDMDTHPDGTLYGITSSNLKKFDPDANQWVDKGSLGISGTPNGLAIDNTGTAYITASNDVYTVDLATADTTSVGSMGANYNSSGDCVVNKNNSLFMSSDHQLFEDTLVLIDGQTAQTQAVGPIGFAEVYGLTAAWGKMFGLTDAGELIEIDTTTGAATLVHQFSQISWYGAASTPQR